MADRVLCDFCDELATSMYSSGMHSTRRVTCEQHTVRVGAPRVGGPRSENDWVREGGIFEIVLAQVRHRNRQS